MHFKSIDYTISMFMINVYIACVHWFTRTYPMQPICTWIRMNRILIN